MKYSSSVLLLGSLLVLATSLVTTRVAQVAAAELPFGGNSSTNGSDSSGAISKQEGSGSTIPTNTAASGGDGAGGGNASTASDNFKAYGLPFFLMGVLIATVALNHKQLLRAVTAKSEDHEGKWLFRIALFNAALSVFLFFTTAWAMGLVSALVCYCLAIFTGSTGGLIGHGKFLLVLQGGWFSVLVGMPTVFSKGIIDKLSSASCQSYYGTAHTSMCVTGWLTFAELVAGIILCLNFISLLMVCSFAVDVTSPGEHGLRQVGSGQLEVEQSLTAKEA